MSKKIKIIYNAKPRVPHKYEIGKIINNQKILSKIYIERSNGTKIKGYEI